MSKLIAEGTIINMAIQFLPIFYYHSKLSIWVKPTPLLLKEAF